MGLSSNLVAEETFCLRCQGPFNLINKMNALETYWSHVEQQLARVKGQQKPVLEQAAQIVAEALRQERFIYVFGSGHSHTLGEEAFYRAGGLVRAIAILDENLMVHRSATGSTEWERKEGYAASVLSRYALGTGDVLFVISSSGRNAVPIDMALEGKRRGATVIAITSVLYSSSVTSRHSSGNKLSDIADLVIDNGSEAGDAVVEIPPLPQKVGPTSTITCAFIWNSIVVSAVSRLAESGGTPEVYASANSGLEHLNAGYLARYKGTIPHL